MISLEIPTEIWLTKDGFYQKVFGMLNLDMLHQDNVVLGSNKSQVSNTQEHSRIQFVVQTMWFSQHFCCYHDMLVNS